MIDVRGLATKSLKVVDYELKHYAEKSLPTCEFLSERGFYDTAAKFIGLKPNEKIIVDAGCGDCRLIESIERNSGQNITVIGIDINPYMLERGYAFLKKSGYKINKHTGTILSIDPNTKKLSLVSDLYLDKNRRFGFRSNEINLLQEDFRFSEILQRGLKEDLGENVDVISYTLPGSFPHTLLEREKYDPVSAGFEMNEYVFARGYEILKENGRMVWALRYAMRDPEKLEESGKEDFKAYGKFFDIKRVKTVRIDERKEKSLKLYLPGCYVQNDKIYALEDTRNIDTDMESVILLIEMVKK